MPAPKSYKIGNLEFTGDMAKLVEITKIGADKGKINKSLITELIFLSSASIWPQKTKEKMDQLIEQINGRLIGDESITTDQSDRLIVFINEFAETYKNIFDGNFKPRKINDLTVEKRTAFINYLKALIALTTADVNNTIVPILEQTALDADQAAQAAATAAAKPAAAATTPAAATAAPKPAMPAPTATSTTDVAMNEAGQITVNGRLYNIPSNGTQRLTALAFKASSVDAKLAQIFIEKAKLDKNLDIFAKLAAKDSTMDEKRVALKKLFPLVHSDKDLDINNSADLLKTLSGFTSEYSYNVMGTRIETMSLGNYDKPGSVPTKAINTGLYLNYLLLLCLLTNTPTDNSALATFQQNLKKENDRFRAEDEELRRRALSTPYSEFKTRKPAVEATTEATAAPKPAVATTTSTEGFAAPKPAMPATTDAEGFAAPKPAAATAAPAANTASTVTATTTANIASTTTTTATEGLAAPKPAVATAAPAAETTTPNTDRNDVAPNAATQPHTWNEYLHTWYDYIMHVFHVANREPNVTNSAKPGEVLNRYNQKRDTARVGYFTYIRSLFHGLYAHNNIDDLTARLDKLERASARITTQMQTLQIQQEQIIAETTKLKAELAKAQQEQKANEPTRPKLS
jgi:regulator of replication initiation timing